MSRPVLVTMSMLTGAQIMTAGAALADVIGPGTAQLLALGVAAVQGGLAFYVQGQVTPFAAVAAKRHDDGRVTLGPASTAVMAGEANIGDPATVELRPSTFPGGL